MKNLAIAGFIFIVMGLAALAYGGITYTTDEKVLDIGPLEAEVEEEHTVPLSPIFGLVAIAAGGMMVFSSRDK